MLSPIEFLVNHEEKILEANRQNSGKPKKIWENLEKDLPELSQVMRFNTFKQYLSVFVVAMKELDRVRQNHMEVRQKLDKMEIEKINLEEELKEVKRRLDKVTQDRLNILKELEERKEHKTQQEKEIGESKDRLDKVRQSEIADGKVRQKLDNKPKRICGWSLQHSKDGYYRCYRKIGKKVYSVYLGKNYDLKKAKNLIAEKEKMLGNGI